MLVVVKATASNRFSEGEGEIAFSSAKRRDHQNKGDLIDSATPCHGAQVVGPYGVLSPLRLTVLATKPEDYITSPQILQRFKYQQGFKQRLRQF